MTVNAIAPGIVTNDNTNFLAGRDGDQRRRRQSRAIAVVYGFGGDASAADVWSPWWTAR
jgi:hypothetical protein